MTKRIVKPQPPRNQATDRIDRILIVGLAAAASLVMLLSATFASPSQAEAAGNPPESHHVHGRQDGPGVGGSMSGARSVSGRAPFITLPKGLVRPAGTEISTVRG